MNKVITTEQASEISKQLRSEEKTVVVTGGCFDILHIAHIKLFEKSKQAGDILFVLLESDEKITKLKGPQRPLHTQSERAEILSAISFIDYVVLLPYLSSNQDYDHVVKSIHPQIIAITHGDTAIVHKQRQAHEIGANIVEVIQYIPQKSTSSALKALLNEQ